MEPVVCSGWDHWSDEGRHQERDGSGRDHYCGGDGEGSGS